MMKSFSWSSNAAHRQSLCFPFVSHCEHHARFRQWVLESQALFYLCWLFSLGVLLMARWFILGCYQLQFNSILFYLLTRIIVAAANSQGVEVMCECGCRVRLPMVAAETEEGEQSPSELAAIAQGAHPQSSKEDKKAHKEVCPAALGPGSAPPTTAPLSR